MVRIRQISCYTWYSEVQRFIQTAVRREEPEDKTSTSVCTSVLSVRVTCTGWARGCGTGTCTSRRAGDAQPPSRSWGPLCSAPPLTSSGSGPPRDKPSLGGCWSRSLHLCESTWRNVSACSSLAECKIRLSCLSFTFPIRHAVEKQPVGVEGPVLDEAHVMAGLDARHSEERHSLSRAVQGACPLFPGDANLHRAVGRSFPVTVDLVIKVNE